MRLFKIFYRYLSGCIFYSNLFNITLIFGNFVYSPNFNITNSSAMNVFGQQPFLHFRAFPSLDFQKQNFGSEGWGCFQGSHTVRHIPSPGLEALCLPSSCVDCVCATELNPQNQILSFFYSSVNLIG